jgi:hypothetical protein
LQPRARRSGGSYRGCSSIKHCGVARHRQTGTAPRTLIRCSRRISRSIQYAIVRDYLCSRGDHRRPE